MTIRIVRPGKRVETYKPCDRYTVTKVDSCFCISMHRAEGTETAYIDYREAADIYVMNARGATMEKLNLERILDPVNDQWKHL